MSTLTKTETFFNNLNLTCDDDLFVGPDVHKKSYHVAMFLNDAPAIDFNMAAKSQKLIEKLKPVVPAIKKVVYEAGPTGATKQSTLCENTICLTHYACRWMNCSVTTTITTTELGCLTNLSQKSSTRADSRYAWLS